MQIYLHDRQRFMDICEGKVDRGGITVMKDVSLAKGNQIVISKEHTVNKIQDILWDDVFEQYFLHSKVIVQIYTYIHIRMSASAQRDLR